MVAMWVLLAGSGAEAQEWQEIYTKQGVTVSRTDVEGTKLVAFKGETTMDAPPEKVLRVLVDHDHRFEWVARLSRTEVLTDKSPYDYVVYNAFQVPIFSDRDYVFRAVVTRDASTGVVVQSLASVDHPDSPPTVGVRAELVNSKYRLTPLEGGQTRVEVEILTDPKGSMPTWLVNLIQRSWPLDTLTGIRSQLDDEWVVALPLPGG